MRVLAFRALFALMLTLAAVPAWAQEPAEAEDAELAAVALRAQQVALAGDLAAYGRANEAPEVLIAAARILVDLDARIADGSGTLTPQDLLDEAEALTDDEQLLGFVAELRARIAPPPPPEPDPDESGGEGEALPEVVFRSAPGATGATGGSIYHRDTVAGQATRSHAIIFEGGETARLAVRGNGATDLDYRLYDQAGRLVASDTSTHDQAAFRWFVPFTQRYRLEITNLGRTGNTYVVVTN